MNRFSPLVASVSSQVRAILLLGIGIIGLVGLDRSSGELIYQTDFDEFPVGNDNWHGTDGWVSNVPTGGVQAIDDDVITGGGLGNTASLGFNQPTNQFNTVFRSMNFDPDESDTPEVEIELLMGIQDSTNNIGDSFFVSIYNLEGDLLGALRFSNEDATYGIWRSDGQRETDTGIDYILGELHVIDISINFETNLWSASIDGLPMFTEATLSARNNRERTFGPLAIEWQLTERFVSQHGDNWMLLADLRVATVGDEPDPPTAVTPFAIKGISRNSEGEITLNWPGDLGYTYQIEYSDDLTLWLSDLPESRITQVSSSGTMTFTDQSASIARHYRVIRTLVISGDGAK